jgi:hypothetical protein
MEAFVALTLCNYKTTMLSYFEDRALGVSPISAGQQKNLPKNESEKVRVHLGIAKEFSYVE